METKLNNNVLVVGTSGAGKTRSIVIPNLLQATGSYVVSDPKGNLVKQIGPYLESKGYKVLEMDFIHPEKSLGYNPLSYCSTTSDIRKLTHTLVYELNYTEEKTSKIDPFWDLTSEMLLMSMFGYLFESDEFSAEEKNLLMVTDLLKRGTRNGRPMEEFSRSELDFLMDCHEAKMYSQGKSSWAVERYREFNTAPNKTHATIIISALAKMASFDTLETRRMLQKSEIDFKELGQKPVALFVKVSDTDRSMDALVNLFYSQLMDSLCRYADEECENSCLPIPVQFILDDFATNARIDNFQNIISNIRSRGISAMLMIQSESQLEAIYGMNAQTIIDNCNTYIYMGGNNPETAGRIAKRANKPFEKILNMPISTSWIFRRGEEPVYCNNFDLEWFKKELGLDCNFKKIEIDETILERGEEYV